LKVYTKKCSINTALKQQLSLHDEDVSKNTEKSDRSNNMQFIQIRCKYKTTADETTERSADFLHFCVQEVKAVLNMEMGG